MSAFTIGYAESSITQHASNHYAILESARRVAKEAGFNGSLGLDIYGDGRWAFRLSHGSRVFKDRDGKWVLTHKSAYNLAQLEQAIAEAVEGINRKKGKTK